NDTLAGLVVSVVDADALVVLSDVEGLYAEDPRKNPSAQLLPTVERVTDEVEARSGGAGSSVGTGGMITKVRAAKRAGELGVPTVIASGRRRSVLLEVARGDEVGTLFAPQEAPLRGRPWWIAHALKAKGKLELERGPSSP